MRYTIFSTTTAWSGTCLSIIRIITGLLMAWHGLEVFDPTLMGGYAKWDVFKNTANPSLYVYAGKGAEFISGVLLTLGLLTKVGALVLIITMLSITFFVGKGRFWYEDQHPFLFVLIGFIFLFCGPGGFSVDRLIETSGKAKDRTRNRV